MTAELIVAPSSGEVRGELADAPGWGDYEDELLRLLDRAMAESGAERLEVGELLVAQPLPPELRWLRNGVRVGRTEAKKLVARMTRGEGPYCPLTGGAFQAKPGWDGAVHLTLPRSVANTVLTVDHDHLTVTENRVPDEPEEVDAPVRRTADSAFWSSVAERVGDTGGSIALLCERWAHGEFGSRWFVLSPHGVEGIAAEVASRSLVTVVHGAKLREVGQPGARAGDLADVDCVAFSPPLTAGLVEHREFVAGVPDLSVLTESGFTLVLVTEDFRTAGGHVRSAVVPDADGAVRARWEDPSAL